MLEHVEREADRIARLRKQMRRQDELRFQDPDHRTLSETVYAMLVWKRKAWRYVTHTRGKITPKRILNLRQKFRRKISDVDIVRLLDLRVYRASGAGSPPAATRKVSKAAPKESAAPLSLVLPKRRRPIKTDKRWGRCWTCTKRSAWRLAFTIRGRRVIRNCCTKHAWYEQRIPAYAKQVVVIQRVLEKRRSA